MEILYIDDVELLYRAVKRTLRDHKVVYCPTASTAIDRLIGGYRPDVIICDVYMGNESGDSVYTWLTDNAPDLCQRLAFVSGTTDYKMPPDMPEGVPILEKPFTTSDLRAIIARLADIRE